MRIRVSMSMSEFMSVVVDAIEFEDRVGGGHGARGTGQGTDGAGVEFAQDRGAGSVYVWPERGDIFCNSPSPLA